MEIVFVTGNKNKAKEIQEILGIRIKAMDLGIPEIQSNSLREIATWKVKRAWEEIRMPCFVEDAGLFLHAFHGFPGPYSRYVHETLGNAGIIKLLEGNLNRGAEFRAVVAYADSLGKIRTFQGRVTGTIAERPRGESGFGFDPIFIPLGHKKTFAEDPDYKNKVSHRKRAILGLKRHIGL